MGKAGKARRPQRGARSRPTAAPAPSAPPAQPLSPAERAAGLISAALRAQSGGDEGCYTRCLDQLASDLGDGWPGQVSRLLAGYLRAQVTAAWQRGWQPAELVRHVGRERSAAHATMTADMVAAEMRSYAPATVAPGWAAQVAALVTAAPAAAEADYLAAWRAAAGEADPTAAVDVALRVLPVLAGLRTLERLIELPGTFSGPVPARPWPARVDDRMLGKIRALLAKAESTEFPGEAEALSARAQQLMAKHSIDHALLAARAGAREEPGGRRVPVDTPYDEAKATLLSVVAGANRCRVVWAADVGLATVVGFPADLDATELVFTSLLVQASAAMTRAGGRKDDLGRSRTRAFRQSFIVSYATRVGERLAAATAGAEREAAAEQQAGSEPGPGAEPGASRPAVAATGAALVPFLAARREAVDDAVGELFGGRLARGRAARAGDAEGWWSGRAAADQASLPGRPEVPGR